MLTQQEQRDLEAARQRVAELEAKSKAPQTFEERVGRVPDKDAPWRLNVDPCSGGSIDSVDGAVVCSGMWTHDARFVINLVNNWDRIVEVIGLARRVVSNAERMEDPKALAGLVLALANLDAADVLTSG